MKFQESKLQLLLFQVGWFSKVQRSILRMQQNNPELFNELCVTQSAT